METTGSLAGSSSDLVSDGVDEADALLHETRMVMFWFTFGWPMLMMYWSCVSVAAMVHKSHRKADDPPQLLAYPPQLLIGLCIGLLLIAYFVYAIFLWVHLMFTVFGETGAMCAAADSKEVRRDTRSLPPPTALHLTPCNWH
jgi:cytochrome b subunit of formate dehydrogenase